MGGPYGFPAPKLFLKFLHDAALVNLEAIILPGWFYHFHWTWHGYGISLYDFHIYICCQPQNVLSLGNRLLRCPSSRKFFFLFSFYFEANFPPKMQSVFTSYYSEYECGSSSLNNAITLTPCNCECMLSEYRLCCWPFEHQEGHYECLFHIMYGIYPEACVTNLI